MSIGNNNDSNGRTLHREFVGILFALATAEVAIQAADIVNSDLELKLCLPAYAHLVLVFVVVAASWVGWGQSKEKLSNVENIFSRDFIELVFDVWLVAAYFFMAKGVELERDNSGNLTSVVPSLANESLWLMLVFISYFGWDLLTKIREDDAAKRTASGFLKKDDKNRFVVLQRGWASLVCGGVSIVAFNFLPRATPDPTRVLLGDVALLLLVVLFRVMKLENRSELKRPHLIGIVILCVFFIVSLEASAQFTCFGEWIGNYVAGLIA